MEIQPDGILVVFNRLLVSLSMLAIRIPSHFKLYDLLFYPVGCLVPENQVGVGKKITKKSRKRGMGGGARNRMENN